MKTEDLHEENTSEGINLDISAFKAWVSQHNHELQSLEENVYSVDRDKQLIRIAHQIHISFQAFYRLFSRNNLAKLILCKEFGDFSPVLLRYLTNQKGYGDISKAANKDDKNAIIAKAEEFLRWASPLPSENIKETYNEVSFKSKKELVKHLQGLNTDELTDWIRNFFIDKKAPPFTIVLEDKLPWKFFFDIYSEAMDPKIKEKVNAAITTLFLQWPENYHPYHLILNLLPFIHNAQILCSDVNPDYKKLESKVLMLAEKGTLQHIYNLGATIDLHLLLLHTILEARIPCDVEKILERDLHDPRYQAVCVEGLRIQGENSHRKAWKYVPSISKMALQKLGTGHLTLLNHYYNEIGSDLLAQLISSNLPKEEDALEYFLDACQHCNPDIIQVEWATEWIKIYHHSVPIATIPTRNIREYYRAGQVDTIPQKFRKSVRFFEERAKRIQEGVNNSVYIENRIGSLFKELSRNE